MPALSCKRLLHPNNTLRIPRTVSMVCYNDVSLGPGHICKKVTTGHWIKKDYNGQEWIVGKECSSCKAELREQEYTQIELNEVI